MAKTKEKEQQKTEKTEQIDVKLLNKFDPQNPPSAGAKIGIYDYVEGKGSLGLRQLFGAKTKGKIGIAIFVGIKENRISGKTFIGFKIKDPENFALTNTLIATENIRWQLLEPAKK